jgi:hypothetical protein
MNPLELGDGAPAALSNGNLTITGSSTLYLRRGTMNFPLTGKYYCEFTISAVGSGVSIAYDSRGQNGATQFIQYNNDGTKNINGTSTSYGSSFTTNDVIALAVDADGGNVYFYKNNTSQGAISFSSASMTGVNATSMVFAYTSAIVNANFGQRPFAYTPPTGFVALNTFNLPTPTILQGNRFMDATLYVGNNTTNVIVNQARFQPDFIWIKNRSTVVNHRLFDSVRGVTKALFSSSTAAETTESDSLTAINSNGFTLGADNVGGGVNYSVGNNYVGWQWQAGQGSTSSNTNGSITTTTSVNTTAGFSIIRFTGTQANATIGHGLGVAPRMVIVKTYGGGTRGWRVYHASVGNTGYLILNDTAATTTDSTAWNNTTPTSTVISLGANGETNNGGSLMIAYAWAEIAGFSRINSYTGNGNADGPFVYTGFRPKFILYKNASYAGTSWAMLDSSRNTYNVLNARLFSDSSSAEDTSVSPMDFTSNGFKVRSTNDGVNRNGDTIIYMAFAESPFKNSLAR